MFADGRNRPFLKIPGIGRFPFFWRAQIFSSFCLLFVPFLHEAFFFRAAAAVPSRSAPSPWPDYRQLDDVDRVIGYSSPRSRIAIVDAASIQLPRPVAAAHATSDSSTWTGSWKREGLAVDRPARGWT